MTPRLFAGPSVADHRSVGVHLRRKVRTTLPEPSQSKAPDLLQRDFTAPAQNQRYVGDITYLPLADGGFLYLATVLDLHSHQAAWLNRRNNSSDHMYEFRIGTRSQARRRPAICFADLWETDRGR